MCEYSMTFSQSTLNYGLLCMWLGLWFVTYRWLILWIVQYPCYECIKFKLNISWILFVNSLFASFRSHNLVSCLLQKHIIFKVEDDFVHIEPRSCKFGDKLNMEHLKVEVACLYFLKLYKENRSRGMLLLAFNFAFNLVLARKLNVGLYLENMQWIKCSIINI